MCESREVKIYQQLFDAQVQLSRSLLVRRKHTTTDCVPADCNKPYSGTSRSLCVSSSRGQHRAADYDVEDVSVLPSTVVVDCPSSDIIERLTEKKLQKHKDALKQMDTELTELAMLCETQVRNICEGLLCDFQEVDLRLDTLKDRMKDAEHLDQLSLQGDACGLWEQVEKEVNLKKMKVVEMDHKLTECENQRADKIRAVLKKYCHLLEKIGFLLPLDVHKLIHSKATMFNQSLLGNRRSLAHLMLLLQQENLQQASLLRLHWDNCLSVWRRSQVTKVIEHLRGSQSGYRHVQTGVSAAMMNISS